MSNKYVCYYVAHSIRGRRRPEPVRVSASEADALIVHQRGHVQEWAQSQSVPLSGFVASFIETPDSRRTQKWPQLVRALDSCRNTGATLLIAELGVLTHNDIFTETLLNSRVPFQCLDQPFVDRSILEALYKHAQIQRKQHGKLIREGLKMTSAKSGNPNAAEVISKVNKPKIDTAIVFACLLQPIIVDYRRKGFSQRHMVKMLNEEGFTAPEGGRWVLSQLQKVLDRVRVNELALEYQPVVEECIRVQKTVSQITDALNQKGLSAIKRGPWDEDQVRRLLERVGQIQDITRINCVVLELLPLIHTARQMGERDVQLLERFEKAGIPIHAPVGVGVDAESLTRLQQHDSESIGALKKTILEMPIAQQSLENILDSAAKHVPTYLKIVKVHMEQLARVLNNDAHQRRGLDVSTLAYPVQQLFQIFDGLQEDDVSTLENLAFEARAWGGRQAVSLKEAVPELAS